MIEAHIVVEVKSLMHYLFLDEKGRGEAFVTYLIFEMLCSMEHSCLRIFKDVFTGASRKMELMKKRKNSLAYFSFSIFINEETFIFFLVH